MLRNAGGAEGQLLRTLALLRRAGARPCAQCSRSCHRGACLVPGRAVRRWGGGRDTDLAHGCAECQMRIAVRSATYGVVVRRVAVIGCGVPVRRRSRTSWGRGWTCRSCTSTRVTGERSAQSGSSLVAARPRNDARGGAWIRDTGGRPGDARQSCSAEPQAAPGNADRASDVGDGVDLGLWRCLLRARGRVSAGLSAAEPEGAANVPGRPTERAAARRSLFVYSLIVLARSPSANGWAVPGVRRASNGWCRRSSARR